MNRSKFRKFKFSFICLIALLFANGCFSVKLVTDYDEIMDKQVTEIHIGISSYMQDLADRPAISGADSVNREAKYNSIHFDINSLRLRAGAKEKNNQQIQQVELLSDSWNKVGELQKLQPSKEMVQNAWNGLEITLTAILKLEIAKKKS